MKNLFYIINLIIFVVLLSHACGSDASAKKEAKERKDASSNLENFMLSLGDSIIVHYGDTVDTVFVQDSTAKSGDLNVTNMSFKLCLYASGCEEVSLLQPKFVQGKGVCKLASWRDSDGQTQIIEFLHMGDYLEGVHNANRVTIRPYMR